MLVFLWFVIRRAKLVGGGRPRGTERAIPDYYGSYLDSLAMMFTGLIRRRVASRDMWGRSVQVYSGGLALGTWMGVMEVESLLACDGDIIPS